MARNKTGRLFEVEPTPRKKREWRMHVVDAGDCGGLVWPQADCVFECRRCGQQSEWIRVANKAEAMRGIPCQKCNSQSDVGV